MLEEARSEGEQVKISDGVVDRALAAYGLDRNDYSKREWELNRVDMRAALESVLLDITIEQGRDADSRE